MTGNLGKRLLISFIASFVVLAFIALSSQPYFHFIFTFLAAAVIGGALVEFYKIAEGKGYEPLKMLGIAGSTAFVFALSYPEPHNILLFVSFFMILGGFLHFFFKGKQPLINLSLTFFGLIYLTIPLGLMVVINFEYGQYDLIYLIAVTKATDAGAYFIGKKWGKNKFAPYISPNKTWEGAAGGFIAGIGVSLLLGSKIGFSLGMSFLCGAIMALLSIVGDLSESLLKRDFGVKDSSRLPGLGGLLDIVDSLIFTTPFMYFVLRFYGWHL